MSLFRIADVHLLLYVPEKASARLRHRCFANPAHHPLPRLTSILGWEWFECLRKSQRVLVHSTRLPENHFHWFVASLCE